MAPIRGHPPMVGPSQPAIDGWLHPDFDVVAAALRCQLGSYRAGPRYASWAWPADGRDSMAWIAALAGLCGP